MQTNQFESLFIVEVRIRIYYVVSVVEEERTRWTASHTMYIVFVYIGTVKNKSTRPIRAVHPAVSRNKEFIKYKRLYNNEFNEFIKDYEI